MSKNRSADEEQINLMGRYMMFAMWIGVLGFFSWFFYNWQEKEFNPNQSVSSFTSQSGQTELVLKANKQKQYIVNGSINNVKVTFLLDTGANDVSVPAHIAKKVGLKQGQKVRFETANGIAIGYRTKIDSIKIGEIELHNINASINPNVRFDEILLGMSFLKHVEMIQKNNEMTLRY